MSHGTTRLKPPPHVTVKTLAVEVLEGPDAGKTVDADSEILTVGSAKTNSLVLTDDAVSRYHLELAIGSRGVDLRDLGSTNGTMLAKTRLRGGTVPVGSVLTLGRTKLLLKDGEGAVVPLHDGELNDLVGDSPAMRRIMARMAKVAEAEVPALLIGESGTGKEVVAREIHRMSARADKPFVAVDCGAFSPNLVASELFGHERGAFTSADRQHIGAFERADGGTLFLDEIGELPLKLQPQLLGALERRSFRRLGGQQEIDVDLMVLSATNRDLRNSVNEGSFRLDLYYRLAVVVMQLPALRERLSDIPLLVAHLLRECGHDGSLEEIVSSDTMQELRVHSWPGNVRELRNWVEATLAMGEPVEVGGPYNSRPGAALDADTLLDRPYKEARTSVLEEFERRYIKHLIEACEHNVSAAARRARMDRSYLLKLLQRHDLR